MSFLARAHCLEDNDPEALARACAEHVIARIRSALSQRNRAVIALAGGSSPVALHRALADSPTLRGLDLSRVHFILGDERAVPASHPDSNLGAARRTLLDPLGISQDQVIALEAWSADLAQAARRAEDALRSVCECAPPNVPSIDVLMLGVGADAHILSLFPGCPAIEDDKGRLVIALEDPPMSPPHARLSLTPTTLNAARDIVLLAIGESKHSALARAEAAIEPVSRVPLRLLERARGGLVVAITPAR
ncbi:MAG: 6-phosphogluconolactonase [Deltaproteobacteria bacterium]|nr:6-phosphogluconolactonase [Deltaproteobacteria bacterium]